MESFNGFTFGGFPSSELGIIRVSGGDRYNDDLQPDIKDRTSEVPGVDGEYYFGSNYGPKKITIEIAFDSLTELQLRKLRRVFGTKDTKELIFDEQPYKKYLAKLESPIELSYVCFDEPIKELVNFNGIHGATQVWRSTENTQRIYKGEGTINFVCYYPYAKSVYKVLPDEDVDWAISSGILTADEYEDFDSYNTITEEINIYNAGDLPAGFRLYIPAAALENRVSLIYKANSELTEPTASLIIDPVDFSSGDIGILIDTNNSLIVGVTSISEDGYTTSKNIYNEYIKSGYFFKFETNDKEDGATLEIQNGTSGIRIFYEYIYF